ncbi:DUF421 domain-containing protein [Cesiribacter andamanensis]|uniref:DUF421 domain-containing protein n=1 Tax=Cesiribacter andamanensis AMV16 TaxID=1279009 RepID=M7NNZ9_9BACT|nr:YetF domain-containing protein [Cesiribacter andamanensis]EMR03450.1 hypothetical protein ADICEAN_01383 [Cesiribacter andamanensis AMV16]
MDDIAFFWSGWAPLLRIVVVGSLTYVSIIAILRLSGKRTLASMNAFDFVVTVALGSAYGRILTAKQVSLAEAITTFALLAVLQMMLSRLESKNWFHQLITAQPTLLFYRGRFMEKAMQEQRVRKDALLSAVRQNKLSSLEEVEAIVLETDGSVSVIQRSDRSDQSAYQPLVDRQFPEKR